MTPKFICHSHLKTSMLLRFSSQDDLRGIAAWCCSNSLLANPEKTKLLLFGTPQMLRTFE